MGGKNSFGANALSFADAFGGKAMSMMKQATTAGGNALKYRNPMYQGYQNAISNLGNQANGLLSKTPNANSNGATPKDILKNLSSESATKSSQKNSSKPYEPKKGE